MFVLIRIVTTSLPLIALPALAADGQVATGITSVGPAVFLASDMASYVTGGILMADGGFRSV